MSYVNRLKLFWGQDVAGSIPVTPIFSNPSLSHKLWGWRFFSFKKNHVEILRNFSNQS